jgi:hypothetical protein
MSLTNLKAFVEAEYAEENKQTHAAKPNTKTSKGNR